MKLNEYELTLVADKLKLKKVKQHTHDTNSIETVLEFLLDYYNLENSPIERAFVLSYDANSEFNGYMQVGIGDHKNVEFNLSTCFRFLLLNNAHGCIFVHNHPKGSSINASAEDMLVYSTLKYVCSALNIELFNNIILQDYWHYYDFEKEGVEEFS